MADYQLTSEGVIRLADGAFIPASEANADWRCYLAWVDAGNTADPSSTPATPLIEADTTFGDDPWQAIGI